MAYDVGERCCGPARPSHLFLPFLLYSLLLWALFPAQSLLILKVTRHHLCGGEDGDDCDENAVSSRAATMSTIIQTTQSVGQILIAGTLGALSDRIGRRPVAALGAAGSMAQSLCNLLVSESPPKPPGNPAAASSVPARGLGFE